MSDQEDRTTKSTSKSTQSNATKPTENSGSGPNSSWNQTNNADASIDPATPSTQSDGPTDVVSDESQLNRVVCPWHPDYIASINRVFQK